MEFSHTRNLKGKSLFEFPSNYVVIDIETTGLDPHNDQIIELAAIKYNNFTETDRFSSLVHIDGILSEFITNLTGITTEMLSNAPGIAEALKAFLNFISDSVVIGHNVHFDINFIYDNAQKYLDRPFSNDFVDTLRVAKKTIFDIPNYQLCSIAKYFDIQIDTAHRALKDCETTNSCYIALKQNNDRICREWIDKFIKSDVRPLDGKKCAVKGTFSILDNTLVTSIINETGGIAYDVFYKNVDYLILSATSYKRYLEGQSSMTLDKARTLSETSNLTVLSENDFYKLFQLPIEALTPKKASVKAKDIIPEETEFDESHPLFQKTCVFTGTLERMTRHEAMQLVANCGGLCGDNVTKKTDFLILGNNDYCKSIKDGKSGKQKKAESLILKGSELQILSEDVFYDMIEE